MIPKVNTQSEEADQRVDLPEPPPLELPDWLQKKYPDISNAFSAQKNFNLELLEVLRRTLPANKMDNP